MNLPPKSGEFTLESGNLPAKSGEFARKSGNLPQDLQALVSTLPKKASAPQLEEVALRLCRWQPLSKEELAGYLQRNPNYVQDRLITPLLQSGRLS